MNKFEIISSNLFKRETLTFLVQDDVSQDEVDDTWKPPIPQLDEYQTASTHHNENTCPCPKDYCAVSINNSSCCCLHRQLCDDEGQIRTNPKF